MSHKIKISDSFCEWEYPLDGKTDHLSIRAIYTVLCDSLGLPAREGVLTKSYEEMMVEIAPSKTP